MQRLTIVLQCHATTGRYLNHIDVLVEINDEFAFGMDLGNHIRRETLVLRDALP